MIFIASGCVPRPVEEPVPPEEVAVPEEVPEVPKKIVFYTPAWGIDQAKQIIALFEKENPDVKVELIEGPAEWGGHVERTTLWIETKYPGVDVLYQDDVFTLDGAVAGVWEDLTPHLTKEEIEDLVGLQKEYMKEHGGVFRIPWWNGGSYMYYRKDLFEKEGVAVPKTWEEFLEVGKRFVKDLDGDGKVDQWGYVTQGTAGEMYNNFVEFLYQAGGNEWELAPGGVPTPEARKALEFMTKLYAETAPPGLAAIGYAESRGLLTEGKVAMLRDWADPGRIVVEEGLTDKIGVMNFPAGPAGPYGIGHCWGVVVNKYGANFQKNPDVVIDFVRFMVRPEIHKITAGIEGPALQSVLQDEEFMSQLAEKNIVVPYFAEFLEFRKVRKFPAGQATPYHEGIGRIAAQAAITGELTVDEALVELQKFIDPLIEGKE
ncbi:multiple sugar transport system substrate-binding protein, partial [Candidatus Hakubella thermalkaliphila]